MSFKIMQELCWLKTHFPNENLESGLERVNQLEWNLSIEQIQGEWIVFAGDQAVFSADDKDGLDAFIYGLSLAYVVFPDEIFESLKNQVNQL